MFRESSVPVDDFEFTQFTGEVHKRDRYYLGLPLQREGSAQAEIESER